MIDYDNNCNHDYFPTVMAENWVREECQKCGRVKEYYGTKPGTPPEQVGTWQGTRRKVDG